MSTEYRVVIYTTSSIIRTSKSRNMSEYDVFASRKN